MTPAVGIHLALALALCALAAASRFPALAQTADTISFGAASYSTQEGAGAVHVTVTRTGGAGSEVTVEYATSGGTASQRSDFTPALGTLRFAPGETSQTFTVLVTDNLVPEAAETVDLMLFNPTGGAVLARPDAALLTIGDDDAAPSPANPIDDSRAFVRQHYHDFLNREPDQAGLDFWTGEIESCGADQQCREVKRVNVSAAFFLSIEFQEISYFVRRLYLFRENGASTWPLWREFMRDAQQLGRGVVVGAPGWQERLAANRRAFVEDWYGRNRVLLDPAGTPLTDEQYVDALFRRVSVTPDADERRALVEALGGGVLTRAGALARVADHTELVRREFNPAFVLTQYVGYLRRAPDRAGFEFWLRKLNQFGGNFVEAEMVKAFISSIEYRERFTRSDSLQEAFFEVEAPPGSGAFVLKVNDPLSIAAGRAAVGRPKIFVGVVIKEPAYYNRGWRFHLDPETVGFADFTIEVCDTTVAAVNDNLEAVGGSFLPGSVMCPWNARVVRELPPPPR